MTMRWKIVALLFFCLSSICWGQMNPNGYVYGESVSWVDNTPNCKVNNCFHLSNTTMVKVRSNGGYTVGLDSAGHIFTFNDYPTNNWTSNAPWGAFSDVAVIGSGANLVVLQGHTGECAGSTDYNVYTLAITTGALTHIYGCLTNVAAALDGTFGGINNQGALYVFFPGSSSFTLIGATPNTFSRVAIGGSGSALLEKANTLLYQMDISDHTGNTNVQLPGGSNHEISIDQYGQAYVIGGDSQVYRWNKAVGNWDKLVLGGNATSITTGGSLETFIVGPTQSGANVWRYPDVAELHTFTITGSTGCPLQGCGSARHTPHLSVSMNRKNFYGPSQGVGGQGWVAPNQNINVYASAGSFDPFDCFEGSCTLVHDNGVDCSLNGPDFSSDDGDYITTDHEVAVTKFRTTAGPGSQFDCTTFPMSKLELCSFPVESWCSNTSYPDWDTGAVQTMMNGPLGGWYPYWEGGAWCSRDRVNGVAVGQWNCNTVIGRGFTVGMNNPDLIPCTYNPY